MKGDNNMSLIEIRRTPEEAMEDYFLSCGVLPPPEIADFTSGKTESRIPLKPKEKISLPTKSSPPPQS